MQLAKANPDAVGKIMGEATGWRPDKMGHLFKVLGVRHPDMPPLAGFLGSIGANEDDP